MKYRYSIQHIFRSDWLAWTGILFAALRVSFAYAITHVFLTMLARVQEVSLLAQSFRTPFFDIVDISIRTEWWHVIILFCGILLALGCATRIVSALLFIWFLGVCILYLHAVVLLELGVWTGFVFIALIFGVCIRWGHVWGVDDVISRLWSGARGKRLREVFFG